MLRRAAISIAALPLLLAVAAMPLAAQSQSAPAPAQPQHHHHPPKDDKKLRREQVEALEQQWRTAQLAGDVATMDRLLSDDFLGTTANGQVVTKKQQIERMRNRQVVITRFDLTDVKVKLVGGVAIVNSLAQLEGTMDGKPLEGSFRYTRVYQRLPSGTWQITSFSATRVPHGGQSSAATAENVAPAGGH